MKNKMKIGLERFKEEYSKEAHAHFTTLLSIGCKKEFRKAIKTEEEINRYYIRKMGKESEEKVLNRKDRSEVPLKTPQKPPETEYIGTEPAIKINIISPGNTSSQSDHIMPSPVPRSTPIDKSTPPSELPPGVPLDALE